MVTKNTTKKATAPKAKKVAEKTITENVKSEKTKVSFKDRVKKALTIDVAFTIKPPVTAFLVLLAASYFIFF